MKREHFISSIVILPLLLLIVIGMIGCDTQASQKKPDWAQGLDELILSRAQESEGPTRPEEEEEAYDPYAEIVINDEFRQRVLNFKRLDAFSEGLAAVIGKNGKMGFINHNGDLVIPCKFTAHWDDYVSEWDATEFSRFNEGVAAVKKDGKWGFINPKGEWILEPILDYAWVGDYAEGKAAFCEKEDGLGGFIDLKGNVVLRADGNSENWVWRFFPHTDGERARFIFRDGECYTDRGYIDHNGKIVRPVEDTPRWKWKDPAREGFHNGLILETYAASASESDDFRMITSYRDRDGNRTLPSEVREMFNIYQLELKRGNELVETNGDWSEVYGAWNRFTECFDAWNNNR